MSSTKQDDFEIALSIKTNSILSLSQMSDTTSPSGLGTSPDSLKKSHHLSSNDSSESSFSASSDRSTQSNTSSDIGGIFKLRTKNPNNPLIGFLNINSLRNKITDLRLVMERCLPDILVIEKTKLESDF